MAETKESVREIVRRNKNSNGYTQPSPDHYPHQWKLDSTLAAIFYSRDEQPEIAETEIKTLLNNMDEAGFIPNMRYHKKIKWWDLESYSFNDRSFGSSYTQPPLLAHAVWETYESYLAKGEQEKGKQFLKDVYGTDGKQNDGGLQLAYKYFQTSKRENGNGSKLIGNFHPNETSRDSDPSLKEGAIRIHRHMIIANFLPKTIMDATNTVADGLSAARINIRGKLRHWDPERMREEVYWINDVMFNVLYVNNLRYMAKISHEFNDKEQSQSYENLAGEVEEEILNKMWSEANGFFYNLKANGERGKIASISGLFPLTLENISENQLARLMDKLEDPEWFGTPYPVPSVPVNSQYYDPHHNEKRLWRGPVWINTNFLIAEEGIVKQIERFKNNEYLFKRMIVYLDNLVTKTEELVKKNGLYEFYDPESGKGYRIKDFTWSALALHLTKSRALLNKYKSEALVS